MDKNMWQRVKPILATALEEDSRRWPELIADSCGHDPALCREVESLLAASQQMGDFIERPILDMLKPRPTEPRRVSPR